MRLNRIRIKNLLQYRDFEYEFRTGLTGIIGPNGVGKSNLLRVIKLLLLGSSLASGYGRKAKLARLVTWGEEEGEGELDFSIAGTNCTAFRSIKGESGDLRLRIGATEYRRPSEGYEDVFGLIGAPSAMVENIAFAEQGEIGSMLFGRSSMRKELFQRLFNIQVAESARRLLKEEINFVRVDDSEGLFEMTRLQLADAQSDLGDVLKRIESAAKVDQNRRKELETLVSDFDDRIKKRRAFKDELSKLNLTEADNEIASLQTLINGGDSKVAELAPYRPRLEELLQRYEEQKDVRIKKKSQEARLKKLDSAISGAKHADVSKERAAVASAEKEVEKLRRELLRQTQLLSAFSEEEGVCPTCLQDLAALPADVNEENLGSAKEQLNTMSSILDSARKSMESAIREETKLQELRKERESSSDELRQLGQISLINDEAADQAKATLGDIDRIEEDIRVRRAKLEGIAGLQAEKRRRHEELQTALKMLEVVREDEYNAAVEALARMRQDEERLAGLGGQAEVCRRQVNKLQASLRDLGEKVRSNSVRKAYRDKLEKARDDLHRDRLPACAARTFLQTVNSSLAESISDFQLDFSAWIDPEHFAPVFMQAASHEPQPYWLLSKGQKTALAISFNVALWRTFLPTCDLLVLDEPTGWLDKERVATFVDLLGTIRNWCEQTQSQMLVVTHDERLKGAMDNIIDLTR